MGERRHGYRWTLRGVLTKQFKDAGKAGEGSALSCVTRTGRPRTQKCASQNASQRTVQSLTKVVLTCLPPAKPKFARAKG